MATIHSQQQLVRGKSGKNRAGVAEKSLERLQDLWNLVVGSLRSSK